jgi:hypothetical protein
MSLINRRPNDFIQFQGQPFEKFPIMAPINTCDVLRSISDDKSLSLFNTIALAVGSCEIPISRLRLTRKQYYSRLSAMIKTGLIARENGKYDLTSFGRIVYQAHILIGKAQQNYWKLKAVDAFDSSDNTLSSEERDRLIQSLIADNDLKEILQTCSKNKDNDKELVALQQSLDPSN